MLVTITNASSDLLYVSLLYRSLAAGESVTVSKSRSELDQELEFKKLVTAGTLTLAFATEDGDDAQVGTGLHPEYTNVTRPAATAWPVFGAIWNTDDNALNWTDGTNWRMADGTIT